MEGDDTRKQHGMGGQPGHGHGPMPTDSVTPTPAP
jgi:hypothetical protein